MLPLLHLAAQMILLHIGKQDSMRWFKKLPIRKFVIGENAYVCSETLLTPFSGREKNDPEKDAFNFYLSQLQIHIEQTFGLMTRMENLASASSDAPQECWKSIYVHYKVALLLHQLRLLK